MIVYSAVPTSRHGKKAGNPNRDRAKPATRLLPSRQARSASKRMAKLTGGTPELGAQLSK